MTQPVYDWSKEDAQIIKAAWASDHGRRTLTLIVERLGNLHGAPHSLSHEHLAFDAGRKFVARELSVVINSPLDKIVKEPHEPRSYRPVTATERAERAARKPGHDPASG